jgi:hypothetical protein
LCCFLQHLPFGKLLYCTNLILMGDHAHNMMIDTTETEQRG